MAKKITVWMPSDDISLDNDGQEDIIKAVKAAGGYMMTDEAWNYIAVCPEPFTPDEATEAMCEQSGDETSNPKWQIPEE